MTKKPRLKVIGVFEYVSYNCGDNTQFTSVLPAIKTDSGFCFTKFSNSHRVLNEKTSMVMMEK